MLQRLPKGLRWTIYSAVILAFMAWGFWLTHTQRPDTYMPRDEYDASMAGEEVEAVGEESGEVEEQGDRGLGED